MTYGKKQTLMFKQMTQTHTHTHIYIYTHTSVFEGVNVLSKVEFNMNLSQLYLSLQTNLIYLHNCLLYIILDGFMTCDLQGLQCLAKHAGKNRIYC